MQLSDLVHPRRVILDLDAADKEAALRALAAAFAADPEHGAQLTENIVFDGLLRREQLGTTGTGSGVAIPHCRLAEAPRTMAVVALHRAGLPFESIDGEPVSILVALVGPREDPATHLQVLASLGKALRDERVRDALMAAATAEEACAALAG